jgi:SAM-dependent methyltransferase
VGSYTSQKTNVGGLFREAVNLYQSQTRQIPGQVAAVLGHLRGLEQAIEKNCAFVIRDRDVLDIGAGQFLMQLHYFGKHNRVTGIDFDVIAQGLNPLPYVEMFRRNGWRRTAKTVMRKALGIDRRYVAELKKQLDVLVLPKRRVLQMDACQMDFADASFDFVHCHSVFHHLPSPVLALNEIKRILRPGGVAYISFHLHSSETGSLDPRVFTEKRVEVGLWRHLRPQHLHELKPNAYLNKLRLGQWKELFEQHMPGAQIILNPSKRPGDEEDARQLKAQGELVDYSLDELLTHNVWVLWKKP